MRVLKATRLAGNPHRATVAPRKKANATRTKRKLSPKQIAIFGTKRQKAALKAARRRKRAESAPRAHHRPRTSPNPLVVTLKPKVSARNPHRRSNTTVAAKRAVKNRRRVVAVSRRNGPRKASNKRRTHRTRNPRPAYVAKRNTHHRTRTRSRRNTTRIVVMAPRKQNRRHHATRNPNLFGNALGSKGSLKILGGGLAGVAAAKFIPQILPASVTQSQLGSSTLGKVIITGVSAFVAYWAASKLDAAFGEGVLFGGLMQTASVALNIFLPGFNIAGVPIALSGLADLVQGQFSVPQNPLRQMAMRRAAALPAPGAAPANMPAASGMKVTTSGLGRAYPSAY